MSNIYSKHGDNPKYEYLEKQIFVQLEGFVFKFLKSNAEIEGFASVDRIVKIKLFDEIDTFFS